MYYKNNIELIHLFVIKTKCHIFLQVDIFNKKISNNFFENFPSQDGPDRDETSLGRDMGHGTETRPEPFSGRDTG